MGRQWLHAKREVAGLKKGQMVGKLVKEIMVAAKLGGAGPRRQCRASLPPCEKARKQSVTRDVIERAIKKGAGIGDEKIVHGARRLRGLRAAQSAGDRRGDDRQQQPHRAGNARAFQEGPARQRRAATSSSSTTSASSRRITPTPARDLEAAAIEAGANEVEPLTHEQNDDIPEGRTPARGSSPTAPASHAVSKWLAQNGWTVVTSELGYVAKAISRAHRRRSATKSANSCKRSKTTTTCTASGRR